ncbi:hypothetical protein ELQ90_02730 [Labedella phragmitis]|uniref:Uncharacterized protein n=1 Tax=Labedella phragmitis TaxID=2498849 RepID=A0A3S5CFF1_9MICO|nr:hypothetical protein [Labedella phragmitis]RWZ52872.1 hypothetical protein ELQ90_02730 [Labedella phragmitis]
MIAGARRLIGGVVGAVLSVVLIGAGIVLVFADAQDRLAAATRIAIQSEALDEAPVLTPPEIVARTIVVDSISLDGPLPRYSIVFVDAAGFRTTIDDPDGLVFVDESGYQYVSYGSFGGMGTGSPVPLPRPWIPRLVTGVLAAGLALAVATGAGLALTWSPQRPARP